MPDETEITQSFQSPEPAPPPPPPGPPRALFADVWPWLALLALLAIAGLLIWLFLLRGNNGKGDTVPGVVGLPQQQAIARLQRDGYDVKAILEPANRPRGIVISQIPGGGSRLDKGAVVTLHISNGRALGVTTATTPTTTATQTTTTGSAASQLAVPDVTGQDMVSAAGQIEAAGFVAETQPTESSDTEGTVIAENPPAGTQADAGSTVVLQVAVGPSRPAAQVPNVLGQKAAAARAALLQAGFTVKTENKKTAQKSVGVVVAQRPGGGASQPKYTQVVVTVGSS